MAVIGTGTTVTFSSGFFAEILSIGGPDAERVSIATSHFGTPNNSHTFVPGDLTDWGSADFELAFDVQTKPPIQNVIETITITYPDSAASTEAFSGFMTGFTKTIPLEERDTATATIKVTGDVTYA